MSKPHDSAKNRGVSSLGALMQRGVRRWQWIQGTRIWRTISHFTDVGGSVLSAGMSYQALFAVFAALWVGFGVFGFVLASRPEVLHSIIEQINLFVPGLIGSGDELVDVEQLLTARTTTLVSGIIGGLALLWIMLNWFTGTRRAIRIIFGLDVKQYRNPILLKLRDFALAVLFGVAIVMSAALTVFSSNLTATIFEWLGWGDSNWLLTTLGQVTRYGVMYVFDVIVLIAIHRYLAEIRVGRMCMIAGCALGGAAMLGLKVLGTSILGGATNNPLLAPFVVLIAILIWFNFTCRVLLLTACWIATGADRHLGLPTGEASFVRTVLG